MDRNIQDQLERELQRVSARRNSEHPDGPVTDTNVTVIRTDQREATIPKGSLAFVVNLDKVSMRGSKINVSQVRKNPETGKETGGSVMLASFNENLIAIPLGVLGGRTASLHVGLNVTLRPSRS